MNNKVYNVGILGCANIAIRSLLPTFDSNSCFKVAAIASRQIEKARAVADQYQCKAYGSYDELLDDSDIDLIYMPLPTGLHYEWGIKALKAGKHVLSEKSLGCNYAEVEEMVNLARYHELLLMENFQFRFHSQTEWVRKYIAQGNIGEIRCFRSSFGFPPFKDSTNIRYSRTLGGGALLDAGAYTVKSLHVILPNEHFTFKSGSMIFPVNSEVDIYGGAYLESNNGVIAELAYGFDNYYQCGFEVWGSLGKLTSTRAYTAPVTLTPKVVVETAEGIREYLLDACDHFMSMTACLAEILDLREFEDEYKQNLLQAHYLENIRNYTYGK